MTDQQDQNVNTFLPNGDDLDEKLKPTEKIPSQINARTKIVDILTRVETRQAFTDKLLEREIEEFSELDRNLITEVVNGALRWQYRLDWYLSQLYVGEYDNLIPDVKNNLRSSAYQLMFLDKIPPYAVLNEAVEIAKNKYNQKTANLVNAILRNFLRQQKKFEMMERFMPYLRKLRRKRRDYIICGDWNIAHRPIDLKNWRANQKNSGFLPEERSWMDELFGTTGYVDAFRVVDQRPEQYTWWSNRGRAWEKNVGWRIDYQVVTPAMASRVEGARIYTDKRFSDHAPLIMDYDYQI